MKSISASTVSTNFSNVSSAVKSPDANDAINSPLTLSTIARPTC